MIDHSGSNSFAGGGIRRGNLGSGLVPIPRARLPNCAPEPSKRPKETPMCPDWTIACLSCLHRDHGLSYEKTTSAVLAIHCPGYRCLGVELGASGILGRVLEWR